MCLITVYDDLNDLIIAKFWYPDNLAMIDKLYAYFRQLGLWIGIKCQIKSNYPYDDL